MGKKWRYLRKGAKIHPGNLTYVFLLCALFIAGMNNKDIKTGLSMAGIFAFLLAILWVVTAIDVGKANSEDK